MPRSQFARECRQASRDLRRLPAEIRKALGRRVRDEVAEPLAGSIRTAGSGVYARRVAPTTRVRAGTDPTLVVGGAKRVASGGARGRDLVFGTNFGGGRRVTAVPARSGRRGHRRHTTKQFTRREPFVFGTIARELGRTFDRWVGIVDDAVDQVMRRG